VLLERILASSFTTYVAKEFVLTALMKLTTRFSSCTDKIRHVINEYVTSVQVELQQRSVEYDTVFRKYDHLRPGLLERMPAIKDNPQNPEEFNSIPNGDVTPSTEAIKGPEPQQPKQEADSLLDLLGSTDVTSAAPAAPASYPTLVPASTGGGVMDLLGDLDMGAPSTNINSTPDVAQMQSIPAGTGPGATMDLADLIGGPVSQPIVNSTPSIPASVGIPPMPGQFSSIPAMVSPASGIPQITAFAKNGLLIKFDFEKVPDNPSNIVAISMTATNSQPSPMTDFVFQAAVPKTFQLQLKPPSGSVIPPGSTGSITQIINVANPQKQNLRMRLKISYVVNGQSVEEQGQLDNFPAALMQ